MIAERWDKARVRQTSVKRTKYRAVGPVCTSVDAVMSVEMQALAGLPRRNSRGRRMMGDETCVDCGYHVCSCKPQFMREESPFQPSGMNSVARGEPLPFKADPNGFTSTCHKHSMSWDSNIGKGCPKCIGESIQGESYGYRNPNEVVCKPIRGEHRPDVWRVTCRHCGVADGFCKADSLCSEGGHHQDCADKAENKTAACWRRNDGREFHMLGCRNGQRRCPLDGM